MEKGYRHISLEERDRIAEMKSLGQTMTDMAIALGRSKSTLSRELRRNATPAYKVYLSHQSPSEQLRGNRRRAAAQGLRVIRLFGYLRNKLEQGLSPELIAGRIELELSGLSISHEAIYQYIYHPKTEGRAELIRLLVRGHRKRKSKGIGRKGAQNQDSQPDSNKDRPLSVENRSRFGHWEGDSLVSRKSIATLNSLVERKSRLLLLTRLQRKTAELTTDAVIL